MTRSWGENPKKLEQPSYPEFERKYLHEFTFHPINLAAFWSDQGKKDPAQAEQLKRQISLAAVFRDDDASIETTLEDLKKRLKGEHVFAWTGAGRFLKLLIAYVVDAIVPATSTPETQKQYADALEVMSPEDLRPRLIAYLSHWIGLV